MVLYVGAEYYIGTSPIFITWFVFFLTTIEKIIGGGEGGSHTVLSMYQYISYASKWMDIRISMLVCKMISRLEILGYTEWHGHALSKTGLWLQL